MNRVYDIIPKSVKKKADSFLAELIWNLSNPPEKQEILTVGNYEAKTHNS